MKLYKNIFTKDECDYIITRVRETQELKDFLIYDSEKKKKIIQPEHSQRKGINFFDENLKFVEDKFLKLCNETKSDNEYNKIGVYRFNQYGNGEYINYHGDFDAISHGAVITVGLFLNEDYEGGEFWYKDENGEYEVEQKIGDVVIFESKVEHKITPVTKGVRYSINAWPSYKKLKNTLF